MIREWADEETIEQIDEALTPPAKALKVHWSDDEAWGSFVRALQDEDGLT